MASEDSRNRDGLQKFMVCAISAIVASPDTVRCRRSPNHANDRREPFELLLLCRSQWVALEERNHSMLEVSESSH